MVQLEHIFNPNKGSEEAIEQLPPYLISFKSSISPPWGVNKRLARIPNLLLAAVSSSSMECVTNMTWKTFQQNDLKFESNWQICYRHFQESYLGLGP